VPGEAAARWRGGPNPSVHTPLHIAMLHSEPYCTQLSMRAPSYTLSLSLRLKDLPGPVKGVKEKKKKKPSYTLP